MRKLAAYFKHMDFKKILDVGTGNGNFIRIMTTLTDTYEEMIGIDEVDVAINTSNKNFQDDRISFQKMNGYEMDFEDNTFDLVVLSNTLHHINDVPALLKEMNRVCKEDGWILINEMMSNHLSRRQKSHVLIHHLAAEIDRTSGETHFETMKDVEILKLLEKSSSRQIKDVWPLELQKENENTKEEIDWLLGTIDKLVEQTKDHQDHEVFMKKGNKAKKYIKKNGFEAATQLVVVMK